MFSVWNPPNRFDPREIDWDEPPPKARLEVTEDDTKSILVHNKSWAFGFGWSLNPYRGCTHACAYCYAREHHEYLDLGAGSDFERRIAVKHRAPALLRKALMRKSWKGELIFFSGVTDCYQPLERRYRITRSCLEVCAEFRNPVGILTRSPLIVRDLDLLTKLNEHRAVTVSFSIPIVDRRFCRALEPGTASPAARLRAMATLAEEGIPVGLSLMPMIPVKAVFEKRLRETLPDRADTVLKRYARALEGDASWAMTLAMFDVWHRKLGFGAMPVPPVRTPFKRPGENEQLPLWPVAASRG